jgi:hypothetical protein
MDEHDEIVSRILAKMGTPTEVSRRREASAEIMAARAFALAFHAARHDLLARVSAPDTRRRAAERLLQPDMREFLTTAEDAFAVAVLKRRGTGSGGRVPNSPGASIIRQKKRVGDSR